MKKILCIGNATVDITVKSVEKLPAPGTLENVEAITTGVGGCAANTALALAKLGADVSICCGIGRDSFGDYVLTQFQKAGLDSRAVVRLQHAKTSAVIVTVSANGERTFLHAPGATAVFSNHHIPGHLLALHDIVFVTGALIMDSFDGAPAANILRQAQALNKLTVMDTVWDSDGVWMPKIKEALPFLDVFMPSIDEAIMLTGHHEPEEICRVLLSYGAKNVIIKMGAKGAYMQSSSGDHFFSPSFPCACVADTNGAGDAFCAGFLCALSEEKDFRDCLRFANAVGHFCVSHAGPNSGIPSMKDIEAFLAENKHTSTDAASVSPFV